MSGYAHLIQGDFEPDNNESEEHLVETIEKRVPPIEGQVMLTGVEFDTGYEDTLMNLAQTHDPDEANAITSAIQGSITGHEDAQHKLIIDVDFPVFAVPSSTPGHFHLYIDKIIGFRHLTEILRAMSAAGIVERGYAEASIDQGFTTVRAPWTKKGDD